MCCCGCKLSECIIVIGIFAVIQSIYGLAWNTWVMLMYNYPEIFVDLGLLERIRADFVIIGYKSLVYKIIAVSILANCVWCSSSIFLIVGSLIRSVCLVSAWVCCTIMITLCDIGATVYFAIKLWSDLEDSHLYFLDIFGDITKLSNTSNFVLALLFSRGVVLIFINVVSIAAACKRNIEMSKTRRRRQDLPGLCRAGSSGDDVQSPLTNTTSYAEEDSYRQGNTTQL